MHSRRIAVALAVLTVALGILTAILFLQGLVVPGILGLPIVAALAGWGATVARKRRRDPAVLPFGTLRPATAPPDGHIRFTIVIEGLEPDRIAAVWSDLCQPGRPATEEFRLLFRNFTVVEGRRFRFRHGDPAATAALLTSVVGTAAGVLVRAHFEPAAERTPPWN
jgi:hypothetical protein